MEAETGQAALFPQRPPWKFPSPQRWYSSHLSGQLVVSKRRQSGVGMDQLPSLVMGNRHRSSTIT